jgi:hypothetical protein
VLDELELRRIDGSLCEMERDTGVDDFIALVVAVDGILQMQAKADAAYFAAICGRAVAPAESGQLAAALLKAYRWQYIFSGARPPRFQGILKTLLDEAQMSRIVSALATLA